MITLIHADMFKAMDRLPVFDLIITAHPFQPHFSDKKCIDALNLCRGHSKRLVWITNRAVKNETTVQYYMHGALMKEYQVHYNDIFTGPVVVGKDMFTDPTSINFTRFEINRSEAKTICDPFAGSGTTAIAADNGQDVTLIEKSVAVYEFMKNRLIQCKLQYTEKTLKDI